MSTPPSRVVLGIDLHADHRRRVRRHWPDGDGHARADGLHRGARHRGDADRRLGGGSDRFDLGVFTHCGIDPRRKTYVLIKSRQHFRAGFEPIARHIVLCDGDGMTSSDLRLFDYKKRRKPSYPFENP